MSDSEKETDDPYRANVKSALESEEYQVDSIPRKQNEDTADYWAHQEKDDAFVIELKSRIDDQKEADELRLASPGVPVGSSDPLERRKALSTKVVHKAVKQIKNSQREYEGPGLLWFVPNPLVMPPDSHDLLEYTLLGMRLLSVVDEAGNAEWKWGYFVDHSDFHKYPDLDAVVWCLPTSGECKMLLNPFSDDLDRVRASRLYRFFKAQGATVEPDTAEFKEGNIYLESDVYRGDPDAVLRDLEKQYPAFRFSFAKTASIRGAITVDASAATDSPPDAKQYRLRISNGEVAEEWRIDTEAEFGYWYATPRDADGAGFPVVQKGVQWDEYRAVSDMSRGGSEREAVERALVAVNKSLLPQIKGSGWVAELIDPLPE